MRKGTIGDFSKKLSFWHRLIALCVLNTMVQVSYKNINHKWSCDHVYSFFGKCTFLIKFCINLYVSEQIYVPVTVVHIFQLYNYKHSISI